MPTLIPSGSAISPGGYGWPQTGPTGPTGPTGLPGPRAISSDPLNRARLGSDDLLFVPTVWQGFDQKSAAYTLTPEDSGKLIVCSGGSWNLSLPEPVPGMVYHVKNAQGLTVDNIINLQPGGSRLVDGLTSRALLSEQECTLLTDGANWRTLGLASEAILGRQELANVANAVIRLPNGYRSYELQVDQLLATAQASNMQLRVSTDGGANFVASATYYPILIHNGSTTTVSPWGGVPVSELYLTHWIETGTLRHLVKVKINPGSADSSPTILSDSGSWHPTLFFCGRFNHYGFYNAATRINALLLLPSGGAFARLSYTVKGFT